MEHVELWLRFAAASAIVIAAGLSLTKNAERLALAMGWGQAFAGFVILGWATSLPEVVISISSAVSMESPGQSAGNITGSVIFNLAILALLDLLADPGAGRKRGQTHGISALTLFNSVMLIGLLAVLLIPGLGGALPRSVVGFFLVAGYLAATLHAWSSQRPETEDPVQGLSRRRAALACLGGGLAILGAGLWLSQLGDEMATTFQLEEGLVGTIFLGGVSSLPELVTGLAAVRLGLMVMCAASILGSNVFNLGILGVCELLWISGDEGRGAMILDADDPRMSANLLAGLLLTLLALRLVRRRQNGVSRGALARISALMLAIYVGVLAFG